LSEGGACLENDSGFLEIGYGFSGCFGFTAIPDLLAFLDIDDFNTNMATDLRL